MDHKGRDLALPDAIPTVARWNRAQPNPSVPMSTRPLQIAPGHPFSMAKWSRRHSDVDTEAVARPSTLGMAQQGSGLENSSANEAVARWNRAHPNPSVQKSTRPLKMAPGHPLSVASGSVW